MFSPPEIDNEQSVPWMPVLFHKDDISFLLGKREGVSLAGVEELEMGGNAWHDKWEISNEHEIQSCLCQCRQQHHIVPAMTAVLFFQHTLTVCCMLTPPNSRKLLIIQTVKYTCNNAHTWNCVHILSKSVFPHKRSSFKRSTLVYSSSLQLHLCICACSLSALLCIPFIL